VGLSGSVSKSGSVWLMMNAVEMPAMNWNAMVLLLADSVGGSRTGWSVNSMLDFVLIDDT
jgi:hypothetical protein